MTRKSFLMQSVWNVSYTSTNSLFLTLHPFFLRTCPVCVTAWNCQDWSCEIKPENGFSLTPQALMSCLCAPSAASKSSSLCSHVPRSWLWCCLCFGFHQKKNRTSGTLWEKSFFFFVQQFYFNYKITTNILSTAVGITFTLSATMSRLEITQIIITVILTGAEGSTVTDRNVFSCCWWCFESDSWLRINWFVNHMWISKGIACQSDSESCVNQKANHFVAESESYESNQKLHMIWSVSHMWIKWWTVCEPDSELSVNWILIQIVNIVYESEMELWEWIMYESENELFVNWTGNVVCESNSESFVNWIVNHV